MEGTMNLKSSKSVNVGPDVIRIVAFVLQAFFAEIDLKSSKEEEDGEESIGLHRRRKVGTKTSSEKVNMLIHHMLSKKLNRPQPASA
ncbi:two pore calcium channel protein 1A [Artemisia annua]|uniref:Two pore calcium channel protein 1A n=1 Tax=Artemisia annua TaxID=35608 RepID=A0A2U1KCT9_ARTAN|nr:two pore calcium channel protein 1A [Artemisia annua]